MGLPTSSPLLAELAGELSRADDGNAPYLHGKLSMLVKTIAQELNAQLFLHIPSGIRGTSMIRNVKRKTEISLDLPGCRRWLN